MLLPLMLRMEARSYRAVGGVNPAGRFWRSISEAHA
jgi:hypothetical protein